MKTPWGAVAELHARRLSPGPQPRGTDATRRHQSERLFGALVALVADQGYARTSLRDLAHASGVTEDSFYKCFRNKDECFGAAVEELYGTAIRTVEERCAVEPRPGRRTRAALDGLIGLIEAQPAAARVCVVNVYEAGEPGIGLVERALGRLGRLLAGDLADSSGGVAMPGEVVAALVAGVQMVIHNHLQRGDAEKLPALAPALADWALSYTPPPAALPVAAAPPRRRHDVPASGLTGTDERFLRAVTKICARDGVRRLTGEAIVAEARASLRTLYAHFGGVQGAFLFAFQEVIRRCVAVSAAAYATGGAWPARMDAVNRELFGYLAAEPAFASTVLVEVLGAGADALALRDRALEPFGDFLKGGQELAPDVPKGVREAIVFAVYSLVGREIAERGVEGVPGLVPTATYLELAPYLGATRAAAEAERLAGTAA